ncbi:MAG: hypothetical protein JW748_07530 [Anaerolineales bacterium]|nr:hypothetical protein [Anaerolineales bacterium]
MPGNLSVEQLLLLVAGILVGIAVLAVLAGALLLRRAPRQPFFLIRQQTAATGWRLLAAAFGILLLAGTVRLFGAPVIFQVVTPTPSITFTPSTTLTPTITFTPSRTLRPTITLTASKTFTPTSSPTPFVPFNIQQSFTSNVPPNPNLLVGALIFAKSITPDLQPVTPGTSFQNPIQKIYVVYPYKNVNDGVEWTIIWYKNGELFGWNSKPWYGGPEGIGVSSWSMAPEYFPHAAYEVQIFVGGEWKQSGLFWITGDPPVPTSTLTPSITRQPSQTETPTVRKSEVETPFPTP